MSDKVIIDHKKSFLVYFENFHFLWFFHFKALLHLLVLQLPQALGLGLSLVQALRIAQIVHSNSQKHVQQDVVSDDEHDYKIERRYHAHSVNAAIRAYACVHHFVPVLAGQNLEHGDHAVGEVVEVGARLLVVVLVEHLCAQVVETAAEHLHAEQGWDDDEEGEKQEQTGDGLHRVHERDDEIAEGWPVAGHLEDPEEADAAEHTDAEWDLDVVLENDLADAADDDEAVEAVEHGEEVAAHAECVHFEEHLKREEDNEEDVDEGWKDTGEICLFKWFEKD